MDETPDSAGDRVTEETGDICLPILLDTRVAEKLPTDEFCFKETYGTKDEKWFAVNNELGAGKFIPTDYIYRRWVNEEIVIGHRRSQLEKMLAGALRATIDAHGDITPQWIGSATKRCISAIKDFNRQQRGLSLDSAAPIVTQENQSKSV